MNLVTLVGSLGLLQLVNASVRRSNHVVDAHAPGKDVNWGLRESNTIRLTPHISPHAKAHMRGAHIGGRWNNSFVHPSAEALHQPELPPPASDLPEVLRRIRCCNAYSSWYSLQVSHAKQAVMEGIAYGHCKERNVAVRVGDPIHLQIDKMNEVAFLDSSMIEQHSILFLVVYKGLVNDELKFKSHIYNDRSEDNSATVVTMNLYDEGTYRTGWKIAIKDSRQAKTHRSETLSDLGRDGVVHVHPGEYVIQLKEGKVVKAKEKFVANANKLYSVLRIGSGEAQYVDSEGTSDFPNKLLVFPRDELDESGKSAAWAIQSRSMLVLVMASVLAWK